MPGDSPTWGIMAPTELEYPANPTLIFTLDDF